MPLDLPPALWMPAKPAIIRAVAAGVEARPRLARPKSGMFMVNHLVGFGAGGSNGNDQFTKLLLHCDGADGSTTFVDSSFNPKTVTVVGNAQVDTAQSVFGGGSLLCDGTGDALSFGGHSDLALGAVDFCIDMRIRFAVVGVQVFFDWRPLGVQGFYPTLYITGSTIRFLTNSVDRITGGTTISANTWYGLRVSREGTNTRMYLNGVQEGSTYTDSNTYLVGASRPSLGANGNAGSSDFNGWIDEVRVSVGTSRADEGVALRTQPYS